MVAESDRRAKTANEFSRQSEKLSKEAKRRFSDENQRNFNEMLMSL